MASFNEIAQVNEWWEKTSEENGYNTDSEDEEEATKMEEYGIEWTFISAWIWALWNKKI